MGKPDIAAAVGFGLIVSKNETTGKNTRFVPGPLLRPFSTNSIFQTTICVADFNGDGKIDIAITDDVGGKICVFKNTSTGTDISFNERFDLPAGINPKSIVAADFDKDGKTDIAYVNIQSAKDSISILRNISINNNISFAPRQTTGIFQPVKLQTADMDSDGKDDLVILMNSPALGNFRIHYNNSVPGIISFGPPINFPPGVLGSSQDLKIADMDGDGKPDVILAMDMNSNPQGGITIFRNASSGSTPAFTEHQLPVYCSRMKSLIISDLDGDGKPDIYSYCGFFSFTYFHKNRSIPGNIDILTVGEKSSPSYSIFHATDANMDGKPDLVMAGTLGNIGVMRNTIDVRGAWAGEDTTICVGQQVALGSPVTLNVGAAGYVFAWSSSPGGFTSTESNPRVNPAANTAYFVAVTNPQGCTAYDSMQVTIGGPAPTGPGIPLNQLGCTKDSIQITNPAVAGYTYSWTSISNSFTSMLPDPIIPIFSGTHYYVLETNTGSCISKQNLSVNGIALPAANSGFDRSICIGSTTTIGSSGNSSHTYSWTASDPGYISTTATNVVPPTITTSYYLKQTSNSTGCSGRDTVLVTVLPKPVADAGPDKTICGSDSVAMGIPAVTGLTYQWRVTGTSPLLSTNAIHHVRPAANTQYYLRVSNVACTVNDTVMVNIYPGIPVLTITASDSSLCSISPVQFNANITGSGSFTYQWKKNSLNTGNNTAAYSLTIPQHEDTVWMVISGDIGCFEPTNVASTKIIVRIENRWIGAQYAQWNVASNWSCGVVPDSNTNVAIPAGAIVVIGSNAICRSIRILSGGRVNVTTGFSLTITH